MSDNQKGAELAVHIDHYRFMVEGLTKERDQAIARAQCAEDRLMEMSADHTACMNALDTAELGASTLYGGVACATTRLKARDRLVALCHLALAGVGVETGLIQNGLAQLISEVKAWRNASRGAISIEGGLGDAEVFPAGLKLALEGYSMKCKALETEVGELKKGRDATSALARRGQLHSMDTPPPAVVLVACCVWVRAPLLHRVPGCIFWRRSTSAVSMVASCVARMATHWPLRLPKALGERVALCSARAPHADSVSGFGAVVSNDHERAEHLANHRNHARCPHVFYSFAAKSPKLRTVVSTSPSRNDRYRRVLTGSRWPSATETNKNGSIASPAANLWHAAVYTARENDFLQLCVPVAPLTPAVAQASLIARHASMRLSGPPLRERKSHSSSAVQPRAAMSSSHTRKAWCASTGSGHDRERRPPFMWRGSTRTAWRNRSPSHTSKTRRLSSSITR